MPKDNAENRVKENYETVMARLTQLNTSFSVEASYASKEGKDFIELKKLVNGLYNYAKKTESNLTNTQKYYIDTMMKVLYEKADIYIAQYGDGFTGNNLALITAALEAKDVAQGCEFAEIDGQVPSAGRIGAIGSLKQNFGKMTFSRTLFEQISGHAGDNNLKNKGEILDALEKKYYGRNVSYDAALKDYNALDTAFSRIDAVFADPEKNKYTVERLDGYAKNEYAVTIDKNVALKNADVSEYFTKDDKINDFIVNHIKNKTAELYKRNEFENVNLSGTRYENVPFENSVRKLNQMAIMAGEDAKNAENAEERRNYQNIERYITLRRDAAAEIEKLKTKKAESDAAVRNGTSDLRYEPAQFIVNEEHRVKALDIHEPEKQTSANGCWSVSLGLLLKSRGVELPQQYIRAFTPDFTADDKTAILKEKHAATANADEVRLAIEQEIEKIKKKEPVNEEELQVAKKKLETVEIKETDWDIMAKDRMANVFEHSDLVLKTIPNTAVRRVVYDPDSYKFNVDEAKKDLENTLIDALEKNASPVSIGSKGHYRTIVGIGRPDDEGPVQFMVYDSAKNSDTQWLTIDQLFNGNMPQKTEITWLETLKVQSDGKVIGIPEKYSDLSYEKGKLKVTGNNLIQDVNHFQKDSAPIYATDMNDKPYRYESYVAPATLSAPQEYLDKQTAQVEQPAEQKQEEIVSEDNKVIQPVEENHVQEKTEEIKDENINQEDSEKEGNEEGSEETENNEEATENQIPYSEEENGEDNEEEKEANENLNESEEKEANENLDDAEEQADEKVEDEEIHTEQNNSEVGTEDIEDTDNAENVENVENAPDEDTYILYTARRKTAPTYNDEASYEPAVEEAAKNAKEIAADLTGGDLYSRLLGFADRMGIPVTFKPAENAREFEKNLSRFLASYANPENAKDGFGLYSRLDKQLGELLESSKHVQLKADKRVYQNMYNELLGDLQAAKDDLNANKALYAQSVAYQNIDKFITHVEEGGLQGRTSDLIGGRTQTFMVANPGSKKVSHEMWNNNLSKYSTDPHIRRWVDNVIDSEISAVMNTAPSAVKESDDENLKKRIAAKNIDIDGVMEKATSRAGYEMLKSFNKADFKADPARVRGTASLDTKAYYEEMAGQYKHSRALTVEKFMGTDFGDGMIANLIQNHNDIKKLSEKWTAYNKYKDITKLVATALKTDNEDKENTFEYIEEKLSTVSFSEMSALTEAKCRAIFKGKFKLRTDEIDPEEKKYAEKLYQKLGAADATRDTAGNRWVNLLLTKPGISMEESNNIKNLYAGGNYKALGTMYLSELDRVAASKEAKYTKTSEFVNDFDNANYVYDLTHDFSYAFNNCFTEDRNDHTKNYISHQEAEKYLKKAEAVSGQLGTIVQKAKLLLNPVSKLIDAEKMSKNDKLKFASLYQSVKGNDMRIVSAFAADVTTLEITLGDGPRDIKPEVLPDDLTPGKVDLKLGSPAQIPSEQAYSAIYDELGKLYTRPEDYHGLSFDKDFYVFDNYQKALRELRGADNLRSIKNEKGLSRVLKLRQQAYEHAEAGAREAAENNDTARAELCTKLKNILDMDRPILVAVKDRAEVLSKNKNTRGMFLDDMVIDAKDDILRKNSGNLSPEAVADQKKYLRVAKLNYEYVDRPGKLNGLEGRLKEFTDNMWKTLNIFASQMDVYTDNVYLGGADFYAMQDKLTKFVKDRPNTYQEFNLGVIDIIRAANNCASNLYIKVSKGGKMSDEQVEAKLDPEDRRIYRFANRLFKYATEGNRAIVNTMNAMNDIDRDATNAILSSKADAKPEDHYTTKMAKNLRAQLKREIEREGCMTADFAEKFAKYMVLDKLISEKRTETIKRLTDTEITRRAKDFMKSSAMTTMLSGINGNYNMETLKWGYRFCEKRAVELEKLTKAGPEVLKKGRKILEGEVERQKNATTDKERFACDVNRAGIEWMDMEIDFREQERQHHIDETAIRMDDQLDDTIGSNVFFAAYKPDKVEEGDGVYNINQQTVGSLAICYQLSMGAKLSDVVKMDEGQIKITKKLCTNMMKNGNHTQVVKTMDEGMQKLSERAEKLARGHEDNIFDRKFIESAAGREYELAVKTMHNIKVMMEKGVKEIKAFETIIPKWADKTEKLYKPFADTASALQEASSDVKKHIDASRSHFFDNCLAGHENLKNREEFKKLIEDLNNSPKDKALVASFAIDGSMKELFEKDGQGKVPTLEECVKFAEERKSVRQAEGQKNQKKLAGELEAIKGKTLFKNSLVSFSKISAYETDVPLFLENHSEMKNNVKTILHGVFISRCLNAKQKLPDAEKMFKKLIDTKTMKSAMYNSYLGSTRDFINSDKPVQILKKAMVEAQVEVSGWDREKEKTVLQQPVEQNPQNPSEGQLQA